MNSNKLVARQMMLYSNFRYFSLYNYSAKSNPRVYLSLTKDSKPIGDLVFELYHNHNPRTVDNFLALIKNREHGLTGTSFYKGYPGIVIQGGKRTDAPPC